MVGITHDELNCCFKCLPKDYTMIHPETKFIANAEMQKEMATEKQSISWILVKQIFIIGRMTAILYFFAKQ